MKTQLNKKGFTLIELLVVITIIGVLATISFSGYSKFIENARITKAVSVAKNVFNASFNYASDNNGKFPSNTEFSAAEDVFREYIANGYSSDEKDFAVDSSPFSPDGFVGSAENGYLEAFSQEDGYVHWALLGGVSDSTKGSTPLAWENSINGGWNPQWDAQLAGTPSQGRAWTGGKIVVVTVSGKAEALKLDTPTGPSELEPLSDQSSETLFTAAYPSLPGGLGVIDPTTNN